MTYILFQGHFVDMKLLFSDYVVQVWDAGSQSTFQLPSIVPKFYVLTYHIPEKAPSRSTVGMEAEHSSESIHTVRNSLNQTYHTVQSETNVSG